MTNDDVMSYRLHLDILNAQFRSEISEAVAHYDSVRKKSFTKLDEYLKPFRDKLTQCSEVVRHEDGSVSLERKEGYHDALRELEEAKVKADSEFLKDIVEPSVLRDAAEDKARERYKKASNELHAACFPK